MGLYDTVIITCPNCKKKFEEQTKDAGENMDREKLENARPALLGAFHNWTGHCPHCGIQLVIRVRSSFTIDVIRTNKETADFKREMVALKRKRRTRFRKMFSV
jgi:DNA-directed RNA polymerase subunit RPC12/RpoP